ncbi:MAG: hypothetical protein ACLF0P_17670, partial [Thermoanaerobaculia bacterium]
MRRRLSRLLSSMDIAFILPPSRRNPELRPAILSSEAPALTAPAPPMEFLNSIEVRGDFWVLRVRQAAK